MAAPETPGTVLLVSQDKDTIISFTTQLDFNRFNLIVTVQEQEAIKIIRLGWPDVLVIEAESLSCAEESLCRFLTAEKPVLPIIAITGEKAVLPEYPGLNISEVLHKPISSLELTARLKAVLHLRLLEEQLQDISTPLGKPALVLIVEDSPLQRQVLARHLTTENLQVITASTGEEALKLVESTRPDLVILDLILPGMDGFEVCRRLKTDQATAVIPVVIITSKSGREERIRGLLCGAEDFLVKPVDRRELLIRTQSLVRRKQLMDTLLNQANRDPLTELYNRRQLEAELQRELSRAKRYHQPLAMIMVDVDDFKHYNDSNGHQAGDEALRQLAALLTGHTREVDIVCRYGGEEFVILLPQTGLSGAVTVAEKLRQVVEEHPFPHREKQPGGRFTISLGVAVYPDHALDAEGLLSAADGAMYRAKRAGKNRYATAEGQAGN
ncbi:MAG: diguanylate cyclase [Thermoanaerobacteraceae bacterium]|nr:diguanylate cyclase [Thermoanaerobacteraceae bacterium]